MSGSSPEPAGADESHLVGEPAAVRMALALPAGATSVSARWDLAAEPWAVLALAHGAGSRMDHPFLTGFASTMAREGVSVLRFNFAYSEAGRRMPGPAAHAVEAWAAAFAVAASAARERGPAGQPLPVFCAGKSYGGRMASMAAAEGRIVPGGLVYLGYPLHPPGKPASLRVAHLPAVLPPQLFVQGTRDPFADPHEQLEAAVAACRDASILWIEGGGHSFEVKGRRRSAADAGADLVPDVAGWMRER